VKGLVLNFMHTELGRRVQEAGLIIPVEVLDAVRTLLQWSGDNPDREGLIDTPARVGRAWIEQCSGYWEDPAIHIARTFEEAAGYDDVVLLRDFPVHSHCEHHLAPIVGSASIAYLPAGRVAGISQLAQVVQGYSRRLQIQERLTAQIAQCVWDHLRPKGVAVVVKAAHGCMTDRGVRTQGVTMVTSKMLGCFRDNDCNRKEVLKLLGVT
jgi:GTP cyclohydrolase IA